MFQRSWVHILAPYTGWTFFTYYCCKNCNVCLKRPKINEKEAGLAHLKKAFQIDLSSSFLRGFVHSNLPPSNRGVRAMIVISDFHTWDFTSKIVMQPWPTAIIFNVQTWSAVSSVTRKKSPKCYKSVPKSISLEKWKILSPLQKCLRM